MRLITIVLLSLVLTQFSNAQETQLMKYSGSEIDSPYWFKDSFLELADDIEEAKEAGKKLIVYYHQAGCPYCYNLIQQSFLDPGLSQYIQENFDILALNLWGDREVTLPDGTSLSEKELAIKWKIQYTPTLLFFDSESSPILRIDGYRSKEMLAKVLDYVVTGNTETSLAQSIISVDHSQSLYPTEAFKSAVDFTASESNKPLALLFEYPGCEDCLQLHKKVLSRTDTFEQLKAYQAYRFDLSDKQIITLSNGRTASAEEYARELGLTYYPSMVLLDSKGVEQLRVDGYVQSFHFNTALEFVSQKVYQRMPEFQRFINERADRLRDQGQEVVITQ